MDNRKQIHLEQSISNNTDAPEISTMMGHQALLDRAMAKHGQVALLIRDMPTSGAIHIQHNK